MLKMVTDVSKIREYSIIDPQQNKIESLMFEIVLTMVQTSRHANIYEYNVIMGWCGKLEQGSARKLVLGSYWNNS